MYDPLGKLKWIINLGIPVRLDDQSLFNSLPRCFGDYYGAFDSVSCCGYAILEDKTVVLFDKDNRIVFSMVPCRFGYYPEESTETTLARMEDNLFEMKIRQEEIDRKSIGLQSYGVWE